MRRMLKPRKVIANPALQQYMQICKNSIMARAPQHAAQVKRIKCYPTDTRRGRAYRSKGFLSVPVWTLQPGKHRHYFEHYLAHELAHFVSGEHNHTAKFYAVVLQLSPAPELELEYKARNARSAGISKPL